MVDYNKRLVEVDEILGYLLEENLYKIPEEVRNAIKENKDKEYFWKFDETKTLKEQKVSRDTIALLSYLNMEYLLNEKQKKYVQQLHKLNENKLEESKAEIYGVDDLFNRNKIQEKPKEVEQIKKQELVEYKEGFFIKIISKIKIFFARLIS